MRTIKWLLSSLGILAFAFLLWASTNTKRVVAPVPLTKIDLTPGVTADAKELTRITDDKLREQQPQISPDGKKMLYTIYDPSKTDINARHSIAMKTLGTAGVSPLLSEGCTTPSWFPDGKGFLFAYTKPGKPVIAKSRIEQMGINYVSANANGTNDSEPFFFAAQNKVLFFTNIGGTNHVATVENNGLNFTILTEGFSPSPHPKKNLFVFTKKVGDTHQLFQYDLSNSQQTQLTSGDFNGDSGAISPDGKWIVFQRYKTNGTESHIFVMNAEGGNVKQLTTGSTWNWCPTFGPDGYIYFSSNAGNAPDKRYDNYDIWRVKPNLAE
ncbi:MAG: PD40 domain-containing protein [Sphingobacteriales bacterium]|mgnify:CR=1 FL=1|nr:PD40 domain-containing protein [Sphingobacteriales bacterium]OJW02229.1 MAG: hypothetical protein BGO52_22875 [Sphingobacteriales bacterium 44-61]